MTADPINFNDEAEKREPMIWACDCGDCGFMIYDNGDIECAGCGAFQNGCTTHYQTVRKWTRKYRPSERNTEKEKAE